MSLESHFKYVTSVAYYIQQKWKLVSPIKCTCPFCKSALIENSLYDFLFCVNCQKKIKFDNGEFHELIGPDYNLQESQSNNVNIQQSNPQIDEVIEQEQVKVKQSDTNDITSSLLVQGWKMTNKSCPTPQCYNPLMQKPQSSELLCGKCKFQTTINEQLREISLSVDPKDLARQIVEKVNKKIEYHEYNSDEQKEPIQNNILVDLKTKIQQMAELILEPCSLEEIEQYSTAIEQVHKVYQIVKNLQE
uniref:Uncharacterized protein n=1 Tax=Trepomonas sp. PC1 TaxID=1076344 RepID=A0A146K8F9_9EUKA|eukprot:JAP92648.1 Hypothetical protein TPC1_15343 [Trepomonas sp. PC1]